MKTEKQLFPNSTIGIVHQTGAEMATREKGITVELHWLEDCDGYPKWPQSAEVYATSKDSDLYVDIGLTWEGNKLIDYDGVFDLPNEVKEMLTAKGAVC